MIGIDDKYSSLRYLLLRKFSCIVSLLQCCSKLVLFDLVRAWAFIQQVQHNSLATPKFCLALYEEILYFIKVSFYTKTISFPVSFPIPKTCWTMLLRIRLLFTHFGSSFWSKRLVGCFTRLCHATQVNCSTPMRHYRCR